MRGKILYEKNCLSCHGEKGLGDGISAIDQKYKPANLQKLIKEVPRFEFFMSVSQWQGDMPGWKKQFEPEEREDLVSYLQTFR
jgi:mono/diheme cytochrome c family protein